MNIRFLRPIIGIKYLLGFVVACALSQVGHAQIKVDVDVVQVYSTVTDLKGRFVTDLKVSDFKIFEDGKEQQIDGFSSDDTPLSVGILLDITNVSQKHSLLAKQSALAFLKAGNVNGEYFLLEVGEKPEITEDFTPDIAHLEKHTSFLNRTGSGSVVDAIGVGLEKLRNAANPRRVLLIFSSGSDRPADRELVRARDLARQLDVQIFGIAISETDIHGDHDGYQNSMETIASVGGEAFAPDAASPEEFPNTCRKIAVGLRNQYVFTYRPMSTEHDGKYRRLQVAVDVPEVPNLFVHTRDGYYARGRDGGLH